MKGLEVRLCESFEEFAEAFGAIAEYGAWDVDDEGIRNFMRVLPLERMHAAFDGTRAVGGAGAFPFDLSVPGGSVACAGITVVGVYPTYRRRGVLTAMMRAQLDAAHERGDPIAALWASDERIYGRYGYGLASLVGRIDLLANRLRVRAAPRGRCDGALRRGNGDPGSREPIWEHLRAGPAGRVRPKRRVVGVPRCRRPAVVASRGCGAEAVRRRGGRRCGRGLRDLPARTEDRGRGGRGPRQRQRGPWRPRCAATAALWRYLFDIEWVQGTVAFLLPVDHPLFLLLARPRRLRFRVGDGLWVRLVDVRAALSARSYASDGSIVIDVTDDFCRWNRGRWKLEDGAAKKTRVASAELACDVSALGSVYLGGFTFEQLVRGGRVQELEPGAAARADALFATERAPWCPEIF